VLGQESQINWKEVLAVQKEINTKCSSIICAQAVADHTSNGDGEGLSERERGPPNQRRDQAPRAAWYRQQRHFSSAAQLFR
jgi:hypothetical protein